MSDNVLLKVASMKGISCFDKRSKLNPHFTDPFEILERIGPIAYHLVQPPTYLVFTMSSVYRSFKSMLLTRGVKKNQEIRIGTRKLRNWGSGRFLTLGKNQKIGTGCIYI
jgi:hypothetical protein